MGPAETFGIGGIVTLNTRWEDLVAKASRFAGQSLVSADSSVFFIAGNRFDEGTVVVYQAVFIGYGSIVIIFIAAFFVTRTIC